MSKPTPDSQLQVEIIRTEDGSHSLFLPQLNETYHSKHGAVQESRHVFIQQGLVPAVKKFHSLQILEIGFGTGLNAFLTALWAEIHNNTIHYTTLETLPLEPEIYQQLNYAEKEDEFTKQIFKSIHDCSWNEAKPITSHFTILKCNTSVQSYVAKSKYHLIYFDAFGPPTQPDMWVKSIFTKMYGLLHPGGILVTYCAKGQVRRDLQSSGFAVERLPGPPGKREMLRATKPLSSIQR